MKLYHVVAAAENRVIGKDNKLPWHFSADLQHFKELTTGSTVIMGRKTFESIGKPLPNRENFVISRTQGRFSDNQFQNKGLARTVPGVLWFDSIEVAIQNVQTSQAFIIGGASLYEQTMNLIDGIYLTKIHARYDGDTFYPEIPASFKEKSRRTLQENPLIEVIYYDKMPLP